MTSKRCIYREHKDPVLVNSICVTCACEGKQCVFCEECAKLHKTLTSHNINPFNETSNTDL